MRKKMPSAVQNERYCLIISTMLYLEQKAVPAAEPDFMITLLRLRGVFHDYKF